MSSNSNHTPGPLGPDEELDTATVWASAGPAGEAVEALVASHLRLLRAMRETVALAHGSGWGCVTEAQSAVEEAQLLLLRTTLMVLR